MWWLVSYATNIGLLRRPNYVDAYSVAPPKTGTHDAPVESVELKLGDDMKTIILFLVIVLASSVSGQIRGTSQVGSLKKKEASKEFRIIITEPQISDKEELNIEGDMLTIHGMIENGESIIRAEINGVEIKLTKDYTFIFDTRLAPGINKFRITASGSGSIQKEFVFYINCKPLETGVNFTIIQPVPGSNNEITVKEKSLLVKISIKDTKDLKEVLINNKKASTLKKSEYYSNVNLQDGVNLISIRTESKSGKVTEAAFRAILKRDTEGPKIVITEPRVTRGIKIVRKSETVVIKGRAEDPSGIYEVTVNELRANLQTDGSFSLNMMLTPGENTLVVKALDNNLNASRDTFYVTRKTEDLISGGKFVGLLIGINSYHGYWPALICPVNDARELGYVLMDKYGFDTVITVYDKDATRKNIIQQLEWLTENLKKDDNLLIFYAGHGQFNKNLNRGYWVPSDAASNSTADYIPNGEIRTFMSGIPAKHILLITDACFGGDIFRGKTESLAFDPNNMERYYREVYRRQSRLALTSGGLEQVRDEGREGHSIFAFYLLKALKENKNRLMDASQLYNELRIAVANNSEQTPILQAVKDTYDEGGQFIFVNRKDE
ncbi:MAG: caspase family protein [Syntrophothermus sp.]